MRVFWLLMVVALCTTAAAPPAVAASADDAEIRQGRVYASRLESQYKVVTDKAVVERVIQIGQQIAAISERPGLPWTFKVLEFKEPNAVSLPGGFVYVTSALLTFVRSDHELAAVLAHEIAHTAHRHQMEMIRRSNEAAFWTVLVAVLTRDPKVAQFVQLVSFGLLAGYTRDLERDADLTSIGYLQRTDYTPVAALTVMERLMRDERYRPVDPVAFRDHPTTEERVAYITAELRRRGIPLFRRPAANFLRIRTRTVAEAGRQIGELYVNDALILRLPDLNRIAGMAAALDRFFDTDPDPGQVGVVHFRDTWEITGGRISLVLLTPSDVAFIGTTLSEAADLILSRLRQAIEQDRRARQFNG